MIFIEEKVILGLLITSLIIDN